MESKYYVYNTTFSLPYNQITTVYKIFCNVGKCHHQNFGVFH